MQIKKRPPICIITHMVLEPSARKVQICGARGRKWHAGETIFFSKFVSRLGGASNVSGLIEGSKDKGVHWTFDLSVFAGQRFLESNRSLVVGILGQDIAKQVDEFRLGIASRAPARIRR